MLFDEFGSFHLSQLVSKDKSLMSYHFGEPFPWLSVKIYARPFWLKRYVIRFQVDVSLADLPPCPNPVSVSFSVQRTVLGLMAIVNPASGWLVPLIRRCRGVKLRRVSLRIPRSFSMPL